MSFVFKDDLFAAQWLRAAGHSSSGGAEVGECLAAAQRIREGDGESWYAAWSELATTVEAQAAESVAQERIASARSAYLRASNYFRAAFTFLIGSPVDPRVVAAYRRQRDCFAAAAAMFQPACEPVEIPYEKRALRGWFLRGGDDQRPRPTLIVVGGYDSTAEELYFFSGAAAVARGYSCLLFDGPGQGGALIEDGLVFRPDWEAVVTPVVDFAAARTDVDRARIALLGISFGGYLAPRAASAEPRLAACIADPGELSLLDEMRSRLPGVIARRIPGSAAASALVAWVMERRMRQLTAGWALRRGLWTHGVDSPLAYLRLLPQYTLEGRAEKIACPTLVCRAESDEIGVTASALYERLTCEKAFVTFPAAQGAGGHCESGARSLFNQRMFDWLDGVLGR